MTTPPARPAPFGASGRRDTAATDLVTTSPRPSALTGGSPVTGAAVATRGPRERARERYYDALARLPLQLRRRLLHLRWHGRLPDLEHPRTFSEKLGWRILNDRRDLLRWTCDKERMKREVTARAPDVDIASTLWFGTDLSELAAVDLPERWVLKPNHRSGGIVYFGRGAPEVGELLRETRGWLGGRQWPCLGEWAYDAACRAYLVEEWLGGGDGAVPNDFKFYVFDGAPAVIECFTDRFGRTQSSFMTADWRRSDISYGIAPHTALDRPPMLDRMLDAASRIARGFDFLRVDLYASDDRVWFGETTPYPSSGLERFADPAHDLALGLLWTLPDLGGASGGHIAEATPAPTRRTPRAR